VIVDSGVWIDHFSGRMHEAVRILRQALHDGDEVQVLPAILQEVLQGTKDAAQFRRYARLLKPIPLVRVTHLRRVAVAAADLYARLRWSGLTIPPMDCFIAASAIATGWPLLTADVDFLRIARIQPRFRLLLPTPNPSA
jgi:predicted nucleic acid-binding protein